jgi:hypothetical protein
LARCAAVVLRLHNTKVASLQKPRHVHSENVRGADRETVRVLPGSYQLAHPVSDCIPHGRADTSNTSPDSRAQPGAYTTHATPDIVAHGSDGFAE